jgi:hypothetical protein
MTARLRQPGHRLLTGSAPATVGSGHVPGHRRKETSRTPSAAKGTGRGWAPPRGSPATATSLAPRGLCAGPDSARARRAIVQLAIAGSRAVPAVASHTRSAAGRIPRAPHSSRDQPGDLRLLAARPCGCPGRCPAARPDRREDLRHPARADQIRVDHAGRQGLPAASSWSPYQGKNKLASQKDANRAHAQLRSPGERARAQLKTWHIPHKLNCYPRQAGQLTKAIQSFRPARSQDEKGSLDDLRAPIGTAGPALHRAESAFGGRVLPGCLRARRFACSSRLWNSWLPWGRVSGSCQGSHRGLLGWERFVRSPRRTPVCGLRPGAQLGRGRPSSRVPV